MAELDFVRENHHGKLPYHIMQYSGHIRVANNALINKIILVKKVLAVTGPQFWLRSSLCYKITIWINAGFTYSTG